MRRSEQVKGGGMAFSGRSQRLQLRCFCERRGCANQRQGIELPRQIADADVRVGYHLRRLVLQQRR